MDIKLESPAQSMHGKTSKDSDCYYYVTSRGKQKYRKREETYQKNQSPRQKWNSLAFSAAHKQIRLLWSDENQVAQITQDWKDAMRIGPQNKPYEDAKGWKFALLQEQWKSEHPFETWYEAYLQDISAKAAEKTASEDTSDYMLRHQIEILSAQIEELRSRLNNR